MRRMTLPPGAVADVRRKNKAAADKAEADRIIVAFCSGPKMFNNGRFTCSYAVGKLLLEHGLTFAAGEGYYAKIKSLGCGVYHVTFEPH